MIELDPAFEEVEKIDWKTRRRAEGMVGVRLRGGYGTEFASFLHRWKNLDPEKYDGQDNPS